MGYLKARVSSLSVKEVELVYLGCLVVALLALPLRPVDFSDRFRYADSAASLLDMKSDMLFAIATENCSRPNNETSLLLNMVTTGNKTFEAGSKKIIFNSTTKMYGTHESRKPVLPRDPTSMEIYISRLDYNSSYVQFLPLIFASASLNGSLCYFGGLIVQGGEKNDSHNNLCDWRCKSLLRRRQLWLNHLNSTDVQVKRVVEEKVEEELDEENKEDEEEVLDMLSSMDSPLTLSNAAFGVHGNVDGDHALGLHIPFSGPECGDKSSNNDLQYTMKVVFITFGSTTLFFIIFFLSWKHFKNLTCLGLSHGLNTFFLSTSTLDETFLTDHNMYEMLLQEATFISSGSSGKVYKIKFLELECAMKVFFPHANMDFRRESVVVANLDHPNIIKFFCCFRKSFIIMELMDEDLYSFITNIRENNSDYELSLEVALDVMLQIAEGMSYLHEGGIAHQDLKSLNIFLKLHGEPHSSNFQIIAKIGDFGSARTFNPRHPRGFFLRPRENIGTRSWNAPELFPPRGGFLTKVFGMACEILPKPLDIYGFAIICSELLTKQIPYSNTNEQRIVHGVELRAGLRPTLPSRGCPEELIALIEDCWHTNPQSRPEFREICTRLSRLIEVQSHEQTPSTL